MDLSRLQYFSNSYRKEKKAFTLVEALVAISIMLIGILSTLILVTRVLYSTSIIQNRLTDSFLAQEGMELIRQKRDSNFVKGLGDSAGWLDGLGSGEYRIDAKDMILQQEGIDEPLRYDKGGFYNYTVGELTPFKRKITIEQIDENQIWVKVLMEWKTKGMFFDLEVEDYLFNWLGI